MILLAPSFYKSLILISQNLLHQEEKKWFAPGRSFLTVTHAAPNPVLFYAAQLVRTNNCSLLSSHSKNQEIADGRWSEQIIYTTDPLQLQSSTSS